MCRVSSLELFKGITEGRKKGLSNAQIHKTYFANQFATPASMSVCLTLRKKKAEAISPGCTNSIPVAPTYRGGSTDDMAAAVQYLNGGKTKRGR